MGFSSHPAGDLNTNLNIRIWEAARATSAAPMYFEPIAVGKFGETFVDGGIGANNPVAYVMERAKHIWPGSNIRCLVSIGTGIPRPKSISGNFFKVVQVMASISTDTERAADQFLREHREMALNDQYFRFSVNRGLENIGMDEVASLDEISTVTSTYCMSEQPHMLLETCASRLANILSSGKGNCLTVC